MVKYGFFNAKKIITGDYDRKYNADDVNTYFKGVLSRDGIYSFVGNQCRVIPAGNMKVAVKDGKGQVNYHWFEVTANQNINIKSAHSTLNRWTAIVVRYNATNRNVSLIAIDGTAATNPIKPAIQRTDTIRDICLAYVYVAAGTTQITSDNITDTVDNPELCGLVSSVLTGNNDIIKIPQLPIASAICQGHIYYLTEKSTTAGKEYVKGFYYCEPSKTNYDYVDYDWMSNILSNRPTAMERYLNVLFYASDNNTWYRCVKTNTNTYEWQTVVVNTVNKLPEPTEAINDKFYKVGDLIYKVEKQESNYKWYPFNTESSGGGGGGSGAFAIIRIEYPAGSEIQVTFDGNTTDAPDTSGVWVYGCDGAGTYTISIKNTTITKQVIITTNGQLENVYISAQIINYALIYYFGNEFTEPSDAEKKYAIKTNGWSITHKGSSSATLVYCFATNANIQTPSNCKLFWRIHIYRQATEDAGLVHMYYGIGYDGPASSQTGYHISESITQGNKDFSKFVIGNDIITDTNECDIYVRGTSAFPTLTKESNCLLANVNSSRPAVYACGFVKVDDISGLSTYGSTISAILANSSLLFDDNTALSWMVLNCTGDFMISALSDNTFINAMNASINKSILLANEHWARFIALLDV